MAPGNRNLVLKIIAIILIIAFAGPEIGLGLEAFAVLEILGAEMFFLSLYIGMRLLSFSVITKPARKWLEQHDPYFFIPTAAQVRDCPGIVSHAIPGLVPIYFAVLACGIF